jgi:hypothetical protein
VSPSAIDSLDNKNLPFAIMAEQQQQQQQTESPFNSSNSISDVPSSSSSTTHDGVGIATTSISTTNRCPVSNDDPSSSTEYSPSRLVLTVCNRTEYRCDPDDDAEGEKAVNNEEDTSPTNSSTTIQFRYNVEYGSTLDPSNVLLYLQETILEHVAVGLNLTECRPVEPMTFTPIPRGGRRRRSIRRRRSFLVPQEQASRTVYAVSGLPLHQYLAPPDCHQHHNHSNTTTSSANASTATATDASTTCSATVQGGVTVWARTQDGADAAAESARSRIQDAMGWLPEPGRHMIERVDFMEFVTTTRNGDDVASPAPASTSTTTWSQNRIVLIGAIGGGSLCLLLLSIICCCFWCGRRRRGRCQNRKRKQPRQVPQQQYVKRNNTRSNHHGNKNQYRKKNSQRNNIGNHHHHRHEHWKRLDDPELPMAQRDSLALRPAGSWRMTRKMAAVAETGPNARSSAEPTRAHAVAAAGGAVLADHRSEGTGDLTNYDREEEEGTTHFCNDTDESETSLSGDDWDHTDSERLVGIGIVDSSCSDLVRDGEPVVEQVVGAGEGVLATTFVEETVEADSSILHQVSSDDDSEMAKQWRNIHSLEGGSTEGYDDEIIEVLGHISFGNESSLAATTTKTPPSSGH